MTAVPETSLNSEVQDTIARFVVNGETVLDQSTSLIWTRENVPGGRMSWKAGNEAAQAVRIDGFTDWRLPTIKELLTLVDYDRCQPAIDTEAFPRCESTWYWSSTPAAFSPAVYAWYVDFYSGSAGWFSRGYSGFVRAVRSSQ